MSFVRFRGKTKTMPFKKTDTTLVSAISEGSLVGLNDSGNLTPLHNDSTDRVIGVSRQTIAATDTSSWDNAPFVSVEVPVENAVEWKIDTDTDGGAVDSDVGKYCAVDTQTAGDSSSTRVDISDTAAKQIFITKIVSSTQILGVIAKTVWNRSSIAADTFDTSA